LGLASWKRDSLQDKGSPVFRSLLAKTWLPFFAFQHRWVMPLERERGGREQQ
jgi:hypothetical protein